MKQIASFCINHDCLQPGLYLSRVDDDVVTYDLRMRKPNGGIYLEQAALHTLEHLFATYMRNSKDEKKIVYVGPMGCRTGFYVLVRDTMKQSEVIAMVQAACAYIASYEGAIPGAATSCECGNYLEHDLEKARQYAADYMTVIQAWRCEDLIYPDQEVKA